MTEPANPEEGAILRSRRRRLDILGDPDEVAAIREAERDIAAGDTYSHEEIVADFTDGEVST